MSAHIFIVRVPISRMEFQKFSILSPFVSVDRFSGISLACVPKMTDEDCVDVVGSNKRIAQIE